jgi:hypothetical protein
MYISKLLTKFLRIRNTLAYLTGAWVTKKKSFLTFVTDVIIVSLKDIMAPVWHSQVGFLLSCKGSKTL